MPMPGKRARSAEVAAEEAYRTAEMRRKAAAGCVNREARDDAEVIRGAVERPLRGQKKPKAE
jgi:hypothetical protein